MYNTVEKSQTNFESSRMESKRCNIMYIMNNIVEKSQTNVESKVDHMWEHFNLSLGKGAKKRGKKLTSVSFMYVLEV